MDKMNIGDINELLEDVKGELLESTRGEIYPKAAVAVDSQTITAWTAVSIGGNMDVGDSIHRLNKATKIVNAAAGKATKGLNATPYQTLVRTAQSPSMNHLVIVYTTWSVPNVSGARKMEVKRQLQKAGFMLKDMSEYTR